MSTFNRYLLHFGMIGTAGFAIFVALVSVDGGILFSPSMLITTSLSIACFVLFMTLFFYVWAKPVSVTVRVEEKQEFVKAVKRIARIKWGRKTVVESDDSVSFRYGNKYKDWLVTPAELNFNEDKCVVSIPSNYEEDILRLKFNHKHIDKIEN
ncbi:hypothetical protein [Pseudobutyrivibrio xylanivorans]|uniref:Uncharacterized protein n=1 Tax=Pseudobutyrivibrio xylanivorans DSM 14809 TaxID=1123012 RepID=A0A1M6L6K4_PSEXY|nr:hypothetical protein [Pseudobutyrivibrio xylanivorans]SHJ66851.1 hypothetical protein SAMN02745725_03035 [Pseudobutyrivibrio xylanivorans DSM 14809]